MNLKGLISISGKPGLFKVVSSGKGTLIVESLIDGKRMPAFASNQVSALEEISMYTTGEDMPLAEIIKKMYDKENGGPCVDSKSEPSALHKYFEGILPEYDKERVYNSDLKKLFSWYNLLQSSGMLKKLAEEAVQEVAEDSKKPSKKKEKEVAEQSEDKTAKKETKKSAKSTGTEKKKKTVTAKANVKESSKAKSVTRNTTSSKRGS